MTDLRTHHDIGNKCAQLGVFAWLAVGCLSLFSANADLRTPSWYDPDGVGSGSDWRYRVPVVIPAAAGVSSTIDIDVDFSLLLQNLGIDSTAVDFDENSVRIVRPNGVLASEQEFSDERFGDVIDPLNNARGEIKFILEDTPAAGDYFLYFDIVENGAKPANPQPVINGNFEHSAGTAATRWSANGINTGGGENNEVVTSAAGATINIAAGCNNNAANNVDNAPNDASGSVTGNDWYLIGFRDNCEDGGGGVEQVQLTRTIQNPSGAARGNLTFFFQLQSYDGLNASGTNYDYLRVQINGTVLDHTTLGINNSTAPALRIRSIGVGRSGYGASLVDHGWKQATIDMTQFPAGATNIIIETRHSDADDGYRMWVKIDDVEWAVQQATLGVVQGYGINIIGPNDTSASTATVLTPGQNVAVTVISNAQSSVITADIIDHNGATVASSITLFDDGTHGDAVAGDGSWSNNGSDAAFPTYIIQSSDVAGNNWQVVAYANDSSVSNLGVTNGLLHINGQAVNPITQAHYWNVDEQVFTVVAPDLNFSKLSLVINDPFSGTTNPKRIPGAIVEYRFNLSNDGSAAVGTNTLLLTDPIPNNVAMCVSTICSGSSAPVIFDDSSSPVPSGLTFNYASNVSYSIDGANFTYAPSPDAEGFDSAITHVRFNPQGAFADSGASFVLRWFVRIE